MSDEFEGFARPTKNYFPMPNEWIDICAGIKSLAELKVVQYIIRHTWGYKEYDGTPKTITTDEFMHGRKRADGSRIDKGTGLSNRSVIDGLRDAEKHGYLVKDVDDADKARINKSYALKMVEAIPDVKMLHTSDVNNLHTGIRYEETSQPVCNPFTSTVKNVHSDYEETSQRSEKYTLERHLEKDTKEKQERAFAPVDFLPEETHEHDAQTSRPAAAHDPLPGSSARDHALVGATADVEETAHRIPAIKLNGATNGQPNTLTASASTPGEPENSPLSVQTRHSLQGTGGAATPLVDRSEPRASGKQEKPKRRKKPVEVQLTLDAARLKEWYDELRGLSTSLSKRNVDSWESLTQKKGNDDRDMFLNIVALLDIDPWFEEHKIAVDAYWINRSWENKYIFLRGHKNVPLADKKPMDVYTAASLDPERNKRNLERLKANRLAKEAAQGVNHHGTN